MAMKHLAEHSDRGAASAREIAEQYDIPVDLLAKVLQRLVRKGFLASQHGIRGGYHLARPATTISVADIIEAVDGPLTMTACSTANDRCDQFSKCSVRDPLWRIKDRIVEALATCTIFEMATDAVPDTAVLLTVRKHGAPRVSVPPPGKRP